MLGARPQSQHQRQGGHLRAVIYCHSAIWTASTAVQTMFRYAAFISYASEDKAFAKRVHRTLEAYRIPAAVGSFKLTDHPGSTNRLFPVFLDREELPSGGLGKSLERALADSHALIVICSPHAARSEWVDKEIRYFQSLGRAAEIFAIIVSGEPNVTGTPQSHTECLPSALREHKATKDGEAAPSSVLAGDARKGRDGFRNAWLKVVAGLLNVNLGRLADRDRRARLIRARLITCISIGAAAALLIAALALDESRARMIFREQALRVTDQPAAQARMLLAASRGNTEVVPSAPDVDDLLARQALGSIRISTMQDLGKWAVSPRGDRLITWSPKQAGEAGEEGELHNTVDGGVTARLVVYRAEFSPSSDSLVVWRNVSSAALHLASTGALVANLGENVRDVVFSPQGDRVLGLPSGELRDTRTGALVSTLEDVYSVEEVQFATRSRKIAIKHGLGPWQLHDAESGVALTSLGRHDALLLSPTGERLVTVAGKEPTMQMWDTTDFEKLKFPVADLRDISGRVLSQLGEVLKYQFSPDGQRLVTNHGALMLWNAVTGKRLAEFSELSEFVVAPDGLTMAGWGANGGALIDIRSGRKIVDLPEMIPEDFQSRLNATLHFHLSSAIFSGDGSLLAASSTAGGKLRDAHTGAILAGNLPFGDVFVPGNHWFGSYVFYDVRERRTVFDLNIPQRLESGRTAFSADGKTGFTDDGPHIMVLRLEEPLHAPPGAGRHANICRINYEAVGQFDTLYIPAGDVVRRLAGRPPHPCDWRGMWSITGWAQALRNWSVRLGADWDYEKDECTREHPGFGCPARGARH